MTLFPDMCNAFLHESIIGRAIAAGTVDVECTDIRPFTENKHGRTDDYPYGGGRGMVMSAQPIYDCYRAICEKRGDNPPVIYMSPKGITYDDFYVWNDDATEARDKYLRGEVTVEEALKIIEGND